MSHNPLNCVTFHWYCYFIDANLCSLVVAIPLCLLFILRRPFHLNHLVFLIDVIYKEVSPSKFLIYLIFSHFQGMEYLFLCFYALWVFGS